MIQFYASKLKMKNKLAFTMIEFLMVVVLLGIVSIVSINYFSENEDEVRFQKTKYELEIIKNALVGDRREIQNFEKTNWGIQSDIGGMPASLSSLLTVGILTPYAVNKDKFISAGWRGPYLTDPTGKEDYLKDEWGRDYIYRPSSDPMTLGSLGKDGAIGGTGFNSDIIFSISKNSIQGKVFGIITKGGKTYTGTAEVELNLPDGNGNVTTATENVLNSDNGYFEFLNVSFGKRSFTIYLPDKATATETIGPIEIVIKNSNFKIPGQLTDFSDSTSTCPSDNTVVYAGGGQIASNGTWGSATNRYVKFNYSVTAAIKVYRLVSTWANSRNLADLRINSTNYNVGGISSGTSYSIATTDFGIQSNVTAELKFSNNMTTTTPSQSGFPFRMVIEHSKGCSEIYFVPP